MRIAIKENNILRALSKWDEYDFVNKGSKVKKFMRNDAGKYEMVEYFNKHPYITEPPYNYQLVDVDIDSYDIETSDFDCVNGVFVFNQARRQHRVANAQNIAALKAEYDAITKWFSNYDIMVAEHARCVRLGTTCHHNLVSLDVEASQKQVRLKQIKQALNVQ